MTQSLIKKIASRFLKREALSNVTVKNVQDESKYVPLKDMHVGFNTMLLLRRLFNEGDIDQAQSDKFLLSAQSFYKESLLYVLNKMDSKHDFWIHDVWINFFNRENEHWDDINYFVERYELILNFDEYSYKLLYDQFHEYNVVNENEIKLEETIISEYDDGSKGYRMDTIWYMLNNLISLFRNNSRFHLLFRVARLILITPHSNSGIERVYSLMNKNNRRPRLRAETFASLAISFHVLSFANFLMR